MQTLKNLRPECEMGIHGNSKPLAYKHLDDDVMNQKANWRNVHFPHIMREIWQHRTFI